MLEELSTLMGETRAPQLLRRLESTWEVNHLAFSPEGNRIVSSASLEITETSFTSAIACWDSATGEPLWAVTHTSWAFSPQFLPDGRQIVVSAGLPDMRGGVTGQLLLLDARDGTVQQAIADLPGAKSIAISPDGRSVAIGSQERYEDYRSSGDRGMAAVYDLATGEQTLKVAPHLNYVTALAFAPDGETFATSSHLRDADPEAKDLWRGGDIRIWNSASGELRHKWVRPNGRGMRHTIAFSPDGRLLASPNGREGEVLLWNTGSGALVRTLAGSGEPVFVLAFSPDGSLLACGCGDNTVRLWNPHTGRLERDLTEFDHCIYALAFSPDGKRLVTADKSGAVKFWAI